MVEHILIENTVSKARLELDKVSTPYYILDTVDWGQVNSKAQTYKYTNQVGESVENVLIGTRPISITGWVIARTEDEMDSRKNVLNLFVNPQQEMIVHYDKYKLSFYPEHSIQYGVTYQENNEYIVKFKIPGICYDPLFREEFEEDVAAASTKPYFHFPLIINKEQQNPPQIMFGVRQPSLITVITNNGQVVTGFTLAFVATSTVVNPAFYNVITQEFIKINKTLQAGERIEINTNRGQKSIVGIYRGTKSSYSKYRDLDMSWLQLDVGENIFRYDAESGLDGLDVYVYFTNKYLEVQKCY